MVPISKCFSDLFRWSKAIYSWLGQALTAWDTLFGVAIALTLPFLFEPSQTLKICGLILQFAGTAFVIADINDTRKHFGKPNMLASASLWVRSFPPFRGRTYLATGTTATRSARTMSGSMYVTTNFKAEATIDERLIELERTVKGLQNFYGQLGKQIDSVKEELSQQVEQERQKRIEGENKVRQLLEAVQIDDLHISALGAVWLLVGMVISTLPDELASVYRWLM